MCRSIAFSTILLVSVSSRLSTLFWLVQEIPSQCASLPRWPKSFDLRAELYRIFGVDLTNVPGISAITAQTILCEIGTDVSRFRNASAFASWLGLCPEKKVSGGKVLFTKSRRVRSRVATALRMGAQSLHHAEDYLGEFFRRIVRKLGKPQAITGSKPHSGRTRSSVLD